MSGRGNEPPTEVTTTNMKTLNQLKREIADAKKKLEFCEIVIECPGGFDYTTNPKTAVENACHYAAVWGSTDNINIQVWDKNEDLVNNWDLSDYYELDGLKIFDELKKRLSESPDAWDTGKLAKQFAAALGRSGAKRLFESKIRNVKVREAALQLIGC